MSSSHIEIPAETQNNNASRSGLQFHYESDGTKIISILEKRLPKSANVYNMCRVYDNFKKPEEMAFYLMHTTTNTEDQDNCEKTNLEESVWILATYYREDYGNRYAISAPQNAETSNKIMEAFVKCPYIDWNKQYNFACIDFDISPMIWEISTKIIGNSVCNMPCKIFTVSTKEAANLDLTLPDNFSNEFDLQPLDRVKGTEFICNTWKYTVPRKTEIAIEKLLSRNKSIGIYEKGSGNVVCGMCVNDCGLMGMLHTLPDHRGKGYATLVALNLIKYFAMEAKAVPCSGVEIKNYKSIAFHEKLGMSFSHFADF